MTTGATQTYQLVPVVTPVPTPPGLAPAASLPAFLGYGLVTPFRRGANDFDADGGAALVVSCVEELLGIKCDSPISRGELPWRTEFGSLLFRLRQHNDDALLQEMAKAYVQDAIKQWEPRVRVLAVTVTTPPGDLRTLLIKVGFTLISQTAPGNNVILPEDIQEATVSLQQAA